MAFKPYLQPLRGFGLCWKDMQNDFHGWVEKRDIRDLIVSLLHR